MKFMKLMKFPGTFGRALLPLLLSLSAASLQAMGVRGPTLIDSYPWTDPLSYTVLGGPRIDIGLVPSAGSGFLCWRSYHRGYPVSTARCFPLDILAERTLAWSLRESWLSISRRNCIRQSHEQGSLVPTIYLPLDMPSILESTIGEGGQIDISGYQKITLSGITHYRPNAIELEGQSQSLFPDLKMEQELRVSLDGTIGQKIHVTVDHDSERSLSPQSTVSLRYEGYEDEIIQRIEMGDISLSITGPEFVSYSIPHQGLFGAKVLAQVGPVEITTIASREAGSTESAEFVGQATVVADSILDIHPADNYFFLTVPDSLVQPEIVNIRIFVDDMDGTNNEETGAVAYDWFLPTSPADTTWGTGDWDELQPGQDLDFVLVDSTMIRFRSPINDDYRLAVWFVTVQGDTVGDLSSGTDRYLKLIKESNPLPSYPTWDYELRNRYYLGANNIVRESFNCTIYLSRSGQNPTPSQEGVPFIKVLGLDTNGDGSLVDEESAVDWDNGFLVFPDIRPFDSAVLVERNPAVYDEYNPLPSQSRYFIAVEYRAASTTYSLGQLGIIPGSETVVLTVAGLARTLVRDVDYTIIYEVGLLSLMGEAAEDAQNPANSLRITYDYLPFFASQRKTLVGTRAEYRLGNDSWVGATAMFESASVPGDRPRVGEESTRTMVADIDAHLEVKPEFLTDLVNLIPGVRTEAESSVSLSGEVAMSFPNPSVEGRVYVDDMEGTESSFPLGQSRSAWHLASIPHNASPYLFPNGALRWYNTYRRWKLGEIVPGSTPNEADNWVDNVLEFYFQPEGDLTSSWGGVIRCMDKYGMDFSGRTHLRLYIRVTGSAQDANIFMDIGERIDEDSYWLERTAGVLVRRANGELDTEDQDRNGILASDEDRGLDNLWDDDEDPASSEPDPNRDNYEYDSGEPPSTRYDKINGTQSNNMLDTEDLNGNGSLDRSNSFFRIRIPVDDPDYIVSGPNEYGWMLIEVPLNDTTLVTVPEFVSSQPTWEKISYTRIWMDGFTQADTVQIHDFSVVGNRWEQMGVSNIDSIGTPVSSSEQFLVSTVNNRDNPDYAANPPPGIDPGEDEYGDPRLEQSLSLEAVDIAPGHMGSSTQSFYSSEDYTGYQELRMLVHGEGAQGAYLFYRMGTDSLNYYEVRTDLVSGWQTLEVTLQELVDLKALKDELGVRYLRQGDLAVRGSPNMASVMQMSLGMENLSGQDLSTTAWVDDITLNDAWSQTGTAHRVTLGIGLADLLTLNGDYREIDADFHGLGSRTGQGRTSTTWSTGATMNLDRFTPPLWGLSAPATFSWSLGVSKPRFQSGSDFRLDEEEAYEQRTQNRSWNTGFQWRKTNRSEGWLGHYLLDPFRFQHTYGRSFGMSPVTRDTTSSAAGTLSYDLSPGNMRLLSLPVIEFFRLRPTRVAWSLARNNSWDTRWSLADEDTVQTRATTRETLSSSGSLSFNFWKGLTASGSLSLTRDLLYPWEGGLSVNVGREVARSQNISISQEINLFDYLKPRLSYDAQYGSARLAPHTVSGTDSLGLPGFSVTATRRLNLRVGLVHTIRSLTRLRDERLDEEAEPGSPRWFLVKLERWANMITDPVITYSVTEGSEYRDMVYYPGWRYQTGLETVLDAEIPWNRSRGRSLQVTGGFRPVSTMSVRLEYSTSDTRTLYSGFWNRQRAKTWPSVSVSWSGLADIAGLDRILSTGSISTGYRIETNESGRFEDDVYTATSETQANRWTPLITINGTLKNEVQLTFTDSYSNTVTKNFTGTQAETSSRNSSAQLKIQYAFSAPGGFSIPLPLLSGIRIRFQSDLTTSLSITRSRTVSELIGAGFGSQLQTDREEWRIEPALNYDFGTVTAGLTGIFGWKTDRVNSQYDQRDTGMNIWVRINF